MNPAFWVSLLGGGLAGGFVNVVANRLFHWRSLRTQIYPKLNNMFAAYLIRMEKPEGRYWVTIVGNNPSAEDSEFVEHRVAFTSELVQFNELGEVRKLRKQILDNSRKGNTTPGTMTNLDLKPEFDALNDCLKVLHKKLKLDS